MDEKEINNITLTYDKNTYTLYFTRTTVEAMENNGFDIREFDKKVFSNIMMLWYGAFAAQHRDTKRVTMDKIWKLIPNKEEMIKDLVTLYSKPYNDLMDEPIDDTKKINWKAN